MYIICVWQLEKFGPKSSHMTRSVCAVAACAAVMLMIARRRRTSSVPRLGTRRDTGQEHEGQAPRRLRKAETVLRRRTSRIIVVLEGSYDLHNQAAVCRTCDCLGIQNVWIVGGHRVSSEEAPKLPKQHPPTRRARQEAALRRENEAVMRARVGELCGGGSAMVHAASSEASEARRRPDGLSRKIAKEAGEWLTLRQFDSSAECIGALRASQYEVWVTALSQHAIALDAAVLHVPPSPTKVAVVFGREADGVSAEMVAAADKLVYFPLHGFSESLNLSVSAALILQTILQKEPSLRSAMSDEDRASLRREWFVRLAKSPEQRDIFPRWAGADTPPEPFDDLRRADETRAAGDNRIPPKIRRKLQQLGDERLTPGPPAH